jgi:hypothetical protein
MADRYPLIANPSTNKIEELAEYDNLNLTNSGIVGASTITAQQFVGNLTGTATSAIYLLNAGNIIGGTIGTSLLSGTYNISNTGTANTSYYLTDAANILSGTISTQRLSGEYPISITGTANTSNYLDNAANINSGIINPARLTGVYNISITGNAQGIEGSVGVATSIQSVNTTSITSLYPVMVDAVGVAATAWTSSTKLYFNSSTGDVTAVDFISTSDLNLKTNIKNIKKSVDKLSKLNGVSFNWKENNISSIGVIAQEVEKVFPELVSTLNDTKTVKYNGLIGVLIEAVKELNSEIKTIQKTLDELTTP